MQSPSQAYFPSRNRYYVAAGRKDKGERPFLAIDNFYTRANNLIMLRWHITQGARQKTGEVRTGTTPTPGGGQGNKSEERACLFCKTEEWLVAPQTFRGMVITAEVTNGKNHLD